MRSLIVILVIIVASNVKAQPPVRISADDFLKAIASHPDLIHMSAMSEQALVQSRVKNERVRLTDIEKSTLELERQIFSNDFKVNALLCFQTCWMLDHQITEVKHFQYDVLALVINQGDAMLKQEVMSREAKLQLMELESKRKEKLKELNALVQHVYGKQPILPEGWVWSFNGDTSADAAQPVVSQASAGELFDDIAILSESFVQVSAVVALQEKFISKINHAESLTVLNELALLNTYKKQRWDIFGRIAGKKSELYKINDAYPSVPYLPVGSN
jgi:hypothetical protein